MHRNIPPVPDHYDYLEAAVALDAKFHRGRSMLMALSEEVERLPVAHARQYMSRAKQWSRVIDLANPPATPKREGLSSAEAFYQGSAAGLALTSWAHHGVVNGTNMVEIFDTLQFTPPMDDETVYERKVAEDLIDISNIGLTAIGPGAKEIVVGWEERCVPDITKQLMFRRGVGMAAFLACRIHGTLYADQDRAKQEAELAAVEAGNYDWNVALQQLDDSA